MTCIYYSVRQSTHCACQWPPPSRVLNPFASYCFSPARPFPAWSTTMVGAEDGRTDGLAGASTAGRDSSGRRLAPASPLSMQTQPKERRGSGSSHDANNNHDDNNSSSSEFSHYFLVAAAAASAQAEAARTASCLPLSPSPHSTTSNNADMLGTAAKPALPSISSSPPLPYLEEKTPFPLSLGSRALAPSASPPTPSGKRKSRLGKLRCCEWAVGRTARGA